MNEETQKVVERYERRKTDEIANKNSKSTTFSYFIQKERELIYSKIIKSRFDSLLNVRLLEIGAGAGANLNFFRNLGMTWENIHANELLTDRFQTLKSNFPNVPAYEGDAFELSPNLNNSFDIVFQSTVFTSLLDDDFKQKLASKLWELVKPGGIILWYDFAFDNPANKDVKGIKKKEIEKLFNKSKNNTFYKVTLAPPIGRRVGKMYPLLNAFPLLRTHLIAVIEKD